MFIVAKLKKSKLQCAKIFTWFIVVKHEEELDEPGQLDCLEHLSDEPQLAEIDDEPEDGELGSVFVKSVLGNSALMESWAQDSKAPDSQGLGPNCPPQKSGQLGPGAQLSRAQFA